MARYKWSNPQEWLLEKSQKAATANDTAELLSIINTVVLRLDADDIQDDFQSEMARDGYFRNLDEHDEKEEDDE